VKVTDSVRWAGVSTGLFSMAVAMTLAGTSAHATEAGWRVVKTVHFEDYTSLDSVVALGKSNAWAFGAKSAADREGPFALRWTGKAWSGVPLPGNMPGSPPGVVTAAGASSSTNVWAAGSRDGLDPYAMRWDGSKWTVVKTWPNEGQITGVTAFSPSDVWVFGAPGANAGLGTWHFDGQDWSQVDTGFHPGTASAVSPTDMWATGRGNDGDSRTLAHYDGTNWDLVDLGNVLPPDILPENAEELQQTVSLGGVKALSRNDVWLTGSVDRSENLLHTRTSFLLHWDGQNWRKFSTPQNWTPHSGIEPDGNGGLWLPGAVESGDTEKPVLMHRSRAGTWTAAKIARSGDGLPLIHDIVLIPGTKSLWAVGALRPADQNSSDGAIYGYGDAVRGIEPSPVAATD
jgi:hypothetical protein